MALLAIEERVKTIAESQDSLAGCVGASGFCTIEMGP